MKYLPVILLTLMLGWFAVGCEKSEALPEPERFDAEIDGRAPLAPLPTDTLLVSGESLTGGEGTTSGAFVLSSGDPEVDTRETIRAMAKVAQAGDINALLGFVSADQFNTVAPAYQAAGQMLKAWNDLDQNVQRSFGRSLADLIGPTPPAPLSEDVMRVGLPALALPVGETGADVSRLLANLTLRAISDEEVAVEDVAGQAPTITFVKMGQDWKLRLPPAIIQRIDQATAMPGFLPMVEAVTGAFGQLGQSVRSRQVTEEALLDQYRAALNEAFAAAAADVSQVLTLLGGSTAEAAP